MNIFYLDECPEKCAQSLCDKHVPKMLLETTQLLCSAHRVLDGKDCISPHILYKLTHTNHPCSKWVRESEANYLWTWKLMACMGEEYTRRYHKVHLCTKKLQNILFYSPKNINSNLPFTDPPQCLPDDCKCSNPIDAYRTYYAKYKYVFAKWKYTPTPTWFTELCPSTHISVPHVVTPLMITAQ